MRAICAWCGRSLGERAPYGDPRITHGICAECKRTQRLRFIQKKRYAMRRSFTHNPHIPGHVEQIKYGPRGRKYYEHRFKPGVRQRMVKGGTTIRPSHNSVLLYHPGRPIFEDDRSPGFWRRYGDRRGGNPMARRRGGGGGDWTQYLLWGTVAYFAYQFFMKPTAVATGGANLQIIPQPAGTIWYSDPLQSDSSTGGMGDQSFFIGSLPPGVSPPWRLASQVEINAMNLGLSAGTLVSSGGGLIVQAANVGP